MSSLSTTLVSDKAHCYLHCSLHYNVDDIAIFVFLYADDILILSPTAVSKLQELLNVIECELQALDLTINFQKSRLTYRS